MRDSIVPGPRKSGIFPDHCPPRRSCIIPTLYFIGCIRPAGKGLTGMVLKVFPDRKSLGKAAAGQAAMAIRRAIHDRGQACVVAATAASQSEFLEALVREP